MAVLYHANGFLQRAHYHHRRLHFLRSSLPLPLDNCHILFSVDIGKPPSHLPIIDGGEGTPELVVIGQEWPEKRGQDINIAKSTL